MRNRLVLTVTDVDKILAAARREAESNGWKVGIAVVDEGGHLLGALRLDGAPPIATESARLKARTSALLRVPSAVLAEAVTTMPGMMRLPDLLPMRGAMPIMLEGECVGAVGAGGVMPQQDEQIANAGVAALGQGQRGPTT